MKIVLAAALALTAASPLFAQAVATPATTAVVDISTATPSDGRWTYSTVPGGSEVTFANATALPQLTIRCARPTRQIIISKPATGAAPFIFLWTSGLTRNVPASFNPATGRISATLSAFDALLDAVAFSRGRMAVSVSGQPTLVLPAWSEAARVIEDCRT
jgi:hypothetical protein